MAHDVYISYADPDKPIADAICAHLEAAGIRCWIASRDLRRQEERPVAVSQAIVAARVMVLVFSRHSNASGDISRELNLAADARLVIIPFKIDDVRPEPGKQYYLARTHWLDAVNPPTREQIERLVERVGALVVSSPLLNPPPTRSAQAAPGSRRLSPRVWAILLGIFLLAGIGWGLLSRWLQPSVSTSEPRPSASASARPSALPTPTQSSMAVSSAASGGPAFTQVYVAEPFNDNNLGWQLGSSSGPDWQGTLELANGILDWQGSSLQRVDILLHPDAASLQGNLTDQEISVRINPLQEDSKGAVGFYLRSQDSSHLYAFELYDSQFYFGVLNGRDHWKDLYGWEYSPAYAGKDWVKLGVQAVGGHYKLFVNDQLLTEVDDATLGSGQAGILLTAYTADKQFHYQIDDFSVLVPAP